MIFFILLASILGLALALKKYSSKESKLASYIFLILIVSSFVITNESNDSFVYSQKLLNYQTIDFGSFVTSFSRLYQSKELMDVANHILLYTVSRFTVDHRVLFGVFATIFGFFYLKSVNANYNDYRKSRNINVYLFFLFFTFAVNTIVNINGFRFWAATWVFFWGVYNVILKQNNKYWIVVVFSMLFHFSFIVPILIFIGYRIIGNKPKLYFILLILSFLVSQVFFAYTSLIGETLGGGAEMKISGYTGDARLERLQEQREYAASNSAWWYMYLPGIVTFYYLLFMQIYLYKKYKSKFSMKEIDLYNFTLLLISAINMMSMVPSMGRFKVLYYLLSLTLIIRVIAFINPKKIKWYTIIGLLPFILNLMLVIRFSMDVINPYLFTLFPFYMLNNDISIYELLFN